MKRTLSLILALCMAFSLLTCGVNAAAAKNQTITKKELPFYLADPEEERTFEVYYVGYSDVPYVTLRQWGEFMTFLQSELHTNETYALAYTSIGDKGVLTREDGYTMTCDCTKDTITFFDYDAFRRNNPNGLLIDVLSVDDPQGDEAPNLFKRCDGSYERYGDMLTLDLAAYGIDMVLSRGECYVPLQTLNDFLLAPDYINLAYTGDKIVLLPHNALGSEGAYTPLGELYYSSKPHERSEALAKFSYAELCLVLDHFYGLKDAHGIESFEQLALQTGMKEALLSTDPNMADAALHEIISYHLDDLHSGFNSASPLSDKGLTAKLGAEIGYGYTVRQYVKQLYAYMLMRQAMRPEGIPCYEEIGNTAYITFDSFTAVPSGVDYYETAPTAEVEDTIGIMLYAYSQIMRENSPVENVVLDLSCNGGGAADAAVFVVSAFLGEGSVSVKNTMSGALATGVYEVDMNLDHKFDDADRGLTKKNLYCLTSPLSFSCGNLVPNVFKNSNMVTLIGRTSGGGSCVVQPMCTAYGTVFQISGFSRLAFVQNGSFYDIDRGAAPDFSITKISTFYDREALTDYICSLP